MKTAERIEGEVLVALLFRIDRQQYALPIKDVLEVVRLPALLELAGAPPAVCGVLNLRGRYLPVLDGRGLVGAPPAYALSHQIVIIGGEEPQLGLLVDAVETVTRLLLGHDEPLGQQAAPFIRRLVRQKEGSAVLLDAGVLAAVALASAGAFVPS